jgi:SAM-dependent methyltransferase
MATEFDKYVRNHSELLRDPIRDKFADHPDFFHQRKAVLITGHLKRRHFPLAQASWLDVGCGKGELLRLAGSSFGRAVGCDPSMEMHRESSAGIYHQSSTTALPFPDASHDFVTAVCVYHHVEEPDRIPLTREIYRVLRPGGIMCMIEHNPFNPVTQLIVKRTPVDVNARLLTASQAGRYMRRCGFADAGLTYFLYFPEKLYARAGAVENWLTRVPLGGQYAVFGQKARR